MVDVRVFHRSRAIVLHVLPSQYALFMDRLYKLLMVARGTLAALASEACLSKHLENMHRALMPERQLFSFSMLFNVFPCMRILRRQYM